MANILKGAPVAKRLNEKMCKKVELLAGKGIKPTVAVLRVGERADDLSYEKGILKRCAQVGVEVKSVILPLNVESEKFFEILHMLNEDASVHGILMFRPLPEHIDGEKARKMLKPAKDIDGCTDGSLAGVFTNTNVGFAPCTAQAAMEILDYYGIECEGKRAAVIGRSLVVGRPVSMMLMHKNATVTTCHTRTLNVPGVTKGAEILIVCSGQMESIGAEYLRDGQVVVDVGIGWNDEKGKLCGDVKFEEAEPIVAAITPVPGGVGAVTTSILVSHVIEAAERSLTN